MSMFQMVRYMCTHGLVGSRPEPTEEEKAKEREERLRWAQKAAEERKRREMKLDHLTEMYWKLSERSMEIAFKDALYATWKQSLIRHRFYDPYPNDTPIDDLKPGKYCKEHGIHYKDADIHLLAMLRTVRKNQKLFRNILKDRELWDILVYMIHWVPAAEAIREYSKFIV